MEFKHFSHAHGLGCHQVPQGSAILCSGCKSSGSGNFYVCWQCRFFLHEHCFRAPLSLNHPSHPLHPLTLAPFPVYPSGSFRCDSCYLSGCGFAYTCSACQFDLHIHCALPPNPNPHASPLAPPQPSVIPSDPSSVTEHFSHPHPLKQIPLEQSNRKFCSACEWELSGSVYSCTESRCNFSLHKACFEYPREAQHKSHPNHRLIMLSAPPNGKKFDCYACYRSGSAYVYTCPLCNYNLHIDCIRWPDMVGRPDHQHRLTLYYSAAEASCNAAFTCDVCETGVNEKAWRYYCRECGFGTHTACVSYQMKRHCSGQQQLRILNV